jgi:hypothetical protein
MKKGNLAASAA